MLSVEDALQRIVAAVAPLPAETVSVATALGRVLAEDLHARTSQPPSDVSAMDGYALRANDLKAQNIPARLTVIGESAAGRPVQPRGGTVPSLRRIGHVCCRRIVRA